MFFLLFSTSTKSSYIYIYIYKFFNRICLPLSVLLDDDLAKVETCKKNIRDTRLTLILQFVVWNTEYNLKLLLRSPLRSRACYVTGGQDQRRSNPGGTKN